MEKNKIVASILFAGLIAMLSGTFAKIIYGTAGHPKEVERGYSIEVVESVSGGEQKEEINILELIASASAEDGKKVAKKCLACHVFEKGGANKVGPALYGILGDSYAHKKDYQYSKAFQELSGSWNYENMWAFINKPSAYVSGTKMAFAGINKPQQKADLIAYLRTMSDSPIPLPKVEPKKEESANVLAETEAKLKEATKAVDSTKEVEDLNKL
jgi:cytochrome c